MKSVSTPRRLSVFALAAVLGTAGWLSMVASPAAAHAYVDRAPLTSWIYTDSLDAHRSVDVRQANLAVAPLGSWRDAAGKHHISRTYATFDLSAYAGKKISVANLFFEERQVVDCSKRSIELWSTAGGVATWANPPAEQALLGANRAGGGVCPAVIPIEVTRLVSDAVQAGKPRVSVEIRVGSDAEGDLAYGRAILNGGNSIVMSVGSNATPTVDSTKLFTAYRPCSADPRPIPLATGGTMLSAMFADADNHTDGHNDANLTAEWAIWPVDHPDQRTVLSERARNGYQSGVIVPSSVFNQGRTYAWQARVSDGSDFSDWSATCVVTVDGVSPAAAPQVDSPTFPDSEWSPGGTPGRFTFSAAGDTDVVGFQYTWNGTFGVPVAATDDRGTPIWQDPLDLPGYARANAPGGSATVVQSPPGNVSTLNVRSIDAAGNVGPQATYRVFVTDTSPRVTIDGAETTSGYYEVGYGDQMTVRFLPHEGLPSPVTRYAYSLGDQAGTVVAGPDGAAEVVLTADSPDFMELVVSSRSANGWVSPDYRLFLGVVSGPKVTATVNGVGVDSEFVLAKRLPDTAGFAYQFDYGDYTTVPAGSAGTATISWTPTTSGSHVLTVWAVDADGNWLNYTDYAFDVA